MRTVLTFLFGDRAWIGRLVFGLACLAYAGYRIVSHQAGQLTAIAAGLGLVVIVFALWRARAAP